MKKTGIYFLIHEGQVVYIGQTIDWPLRLRGHKDKSFDSTRFIECSPDKRIDYEKRLIKIFNPIYNIGGGRPKAENPKIIFPSFRIRSSILQKLQERATKEGTTVAALAHNKILELV